MRAAGRSAVDAFEIVNRALRELETIRNAAPPEPFGELPWPISVGILHAGDWASTVPDRLVAEGRYGVMPGESFGDAQQAFEQAIAAASTADPWLAEQPPVSYTHLRAHETVLEIVCRLLLEKKNMNCLCHAQAARIRG